MNVHTPQRLDGESPTDYKARRRRSQWLVKIARLKGGRATREAIRHQWKASLRDVLSLV